MKTTFNYNLCLICQTVQDSPLRCLAHDKNINHRSDIYESFIGDSILFNSDICTRQLINITLAPTAKKTTIIKYMNEQWKKINQL